MRIVAFLSYAILSLNIILISIDNVKCENLNLSISLKQASKITDIFGKSEILLRNNNDLIYYIPTHKALWHLNIINKVKYLISGNVNKPALVSLSDNGNYLVYTDSQKKSTDQRAHVINLNNHKVVFQSTLLSDIQFVSWANSCRFLVGTSETKPAQIYHFELKDCSTKEALNPVIFSIPGNGNWLLKDGRHFQSIMEGRLFYNLQKHKKSYSGVTETGQLFLYDLLKQTIIWGPYGLKPSFSNSGKKLLYNQPSGEFFLWSWEDNRTYSIKLPLHSNPWLIEDDQLLFFDGSDLKIVKFLEDTK